MNNYARHFFGLSAILLYRFNSFYFQKLQQTKFNARRKFQWAITVVRAVIKIQRLRFTPEPLSLTTARTDPYRLKLLRKVCKKTLELDF